MDILQYLEVQEAPSPTVLKSGATVPSHAMVRSPGFVMQRSSGNRRNLTSYLDTVLIRAYYWRCKLCYMRSKEQDDPIAYQAIG